MANKHRSEQLWGTLKVAISALVFAVALSACATHAAPLSSSCEVAGAQTLKLKGPTDDAMLACIRRQSLADVKIVIVTSNGGSVPAAIAIGGLLSELHAKLVIEGGCNSSCANYLIPAFESVSLRPGAFIVIHGGIDPGFVAISVLLPKPVDGLDTQDVVALQQQYALDHNIGLGWLIFREAADYQSGGFGSYLVGEPDRAVDSLSWKTILVEERLLRSCLPRVSVEPFVDTMTERIRKNSRLRKSMVKQMMISSGTLECTTRHPLE